MRGILAREGGRGLFAGYGSFLLRDLPFDAIEFVAYEQLKQAYRVRWRPMAQPRFLYPNRTPVLISRALDFLV